MSEADNRAGIYNTLAAVTDIGQVYDYERWAPTWDAFIDLFKTTTVGDPHIRGWEISQKAPVSEDRTSVKMRTYSIKGYMSVNDAAATEKTFATLIDAVAAAFRSDQSLGGMAHGHDFIQVDVMETRMFGSVMCHYAELSIVVYDLL